MPERGKLIVVAGGEGAGKDTLADEFMKEHGEKLNFIRTHEPGGSPYAEKLRKTLLYEPHAKDIAPFWQFILMWAARENHMKEVIIPALLKGQNVLCVRFDCCTYAYQVFAQNNRHLEEHFFLVRKSILGEYTPDFYVFLDVLPETGLARKKAQRDEKLTHFDKKEVHFHKKVREGYFTFLFAREEDPLVIIGVDHPLQHVQENFNDTIQKILKYTSETP